MLVIDTPNDLPRGNYDIWLANKGGESAKLGALEAQENRLMNPVSFFPQPGKG